MVISAWNFLITLHNLLQKLLNSSKKSNSKEETCDLIWNKISDKITDFISEINNTQVDNVKNIDVVMPMYNSIAWIDIYLGTSGNLWQHYRDKPALNNAGDIIDVSANNNNDDNNNNNNNNNSVSFTFKDNMPYKQTTMAQNILKKWYYWNI